eukprot:4753081-Alexandrium_andersonii.AAC.1
MASNKVNHRSNSVLNSLYQGYSRGHRKAAPEEPPPHLRSVQVDVPSIGRRPAYRDCCPKHVQPA